MRKSTKPSIKIKDAYKPLRREKILAILESIVYEDTTIILHNLVEAKAAWSNKDNQEARNCIKSALDILDGKIIVSTDKKAAKGQVEPFTLPNKADKKEMKKLKKEGLEILKRIKQ